MNPFPEALWPMLWAGLASALCVRALILPARRFGCLDHPGGRKRHENPTPLVGGVAVFLAFTLVSSLFGGLPGDSLSLVAALCVTVVFGLADDLNRFGHHAKFTGQLVAALIIVSGTSTHVFVFGDLLGTGDLVLGKWAYLVTVICLIGLMNAINMIDGLDGLAGTQAILSLSLFAAVALMTGDMTTGTEILTLIGAISGFLAFNLRHPWQPRARAFMGDVGGLLLGLLLGWYAIRLAGTNAAPLRPITAVWFIALPLLDMGSVMLLRLLRGYSPFHADRLHLHYLLRDAGWSTSQIVMTLLTLAACLGGLGLLGERMAVPEYVMFYAFIGLWMLYLAGLARAKRPQPVSP